MVGRLEGSPLFGRLTQRQASLSRKGEAGLFILRKQNAMDKWIPIFWIGGDGIDILALVLFIDLWKGKKKKQLRNNNRVSRDLSSMDA